MYLASRSDSLQAADFPWRPSIVCFSGPLRLVKYGLYHCLSLPADQLIPCRTENGHIFSVVNKVFTVTFLDQFTQLIFSAYNSKIHLAVNKSR